MEDFYFIIGRQPDSEKYEVFRAAHGEKPIGRQPDSEKYEVFRAAHGVKPYSAWQFII